jgi:hypothetical protein
MPFYVLRDADDMFKRFIMTTADGRRPTAAKAQITTADSRPQTAGQSFAS